MAASGANRVSLHAIALRAGVSTATVSRALRGLPSVASETRSLIERSAADLGYVVPPAEGDRRRTVAVVVPSITGWYHALALEGADEVFRASGCDVLLINLGHRSETNRLFRQSLLHSRVDACLVIAIDFTPQEAEQLQALEIPYIGVGAALPELSRVEIDEMGAAELATRHLLHLGHRRIAHIGSRDDPQTDSTMSRLRTDGWARAMRHAGLEPNPEWWVDGGFKASMARDAITPVLASPDRPTAVFAASDEMAFGAILAAQDLGLRVPDDVSVIGIDDHDYAELLGLTTVRQRPKQQGRTAAALLVAQLNAHEFALNRVDAPVELVQRRSTAPVRSDADRRS